MRNLTGLLCNVIFLVIITSCVREEIDINKESNIDTTSKQQLDKLITVTDSGHGFIEFSFENREIHSFLNNGDLKNSELFVYLVATSEDHFLKSTDRNTLKVIEEDEDMIRCVSIIWDLGEGDFLDIPNTRVQMREKYGFRDENITLPHRWNDMGFGAKEIYLRAIVYEIKTGVRARILDQKEITKNIICRGGEAFGRNIIKYNRGAIDIEQTVRCDD